MHEIRNDRSNTMIDFAALSFMRDAIIRKLISNRPEVKFRAQTSIIALTIGTG